MTSLAYKAEIERMIKDTAPVSFAVSGADGSIKEYGPYYLGRSSKFSLAYAVSGAAVPNIAVDYLLAQSDSGVFVKPTKSPTPGIHTIAAATLSEIVPFDIDETPIFAKIRFSNNSDSVITVNWAELNHA
jgi:hypothetical protein